VSGRGYWDDKHRAAVLADANLDERRLLRRLERVWAINADGTLRKDALRPIDIIELLHETRRGRKEGSHV
jgi:hypothetical protein